MKSESILFYPGLQLQAYSEGEQYGLFILGENSGGGPRRRNG